MRVSSIVLARGGSEGIPNKNIIKFCGQPLLAWTVQQCLQVNAIDDVWISSDSEEILEIGAALGAKPLFRPKEISGDKASSESAWLNAIDQIEESSSPVDIVVAPQVTSPLREADDFSKALEKLLKENLDSLLSVTEVEDYFAWRINEEGQLQSVNYDYCKRQPRQVIEKRYLENGSFYIFKSSIIRKYNNRLGGKMGIYIMQKHKMFQIDNQEDLEICSVIMKGYGLDI